MNDKLKLADAYYAAAADLERQADSLNSAAFICAKMADQLCNQSISEKAKANDSAISAAKEKP